MKKKYVKDYLPDDSSKNGLCYVGDYFTHDIGREERRRGGILQILSAIVEVVLILGAASINCIGNRTVYIIIPLECMLPCAYFYITGSYFYLKCGNRMERRQYESAFERPVQAVTVALILNLVSGVGELVLLVKNRGEWEGYAEYTLFALLIVLFLMNCASWNSQRKLNGRVKQEKVPKESLEIHDNQGRSL